LDDKDTTYGQKDARGADDNLFIENRLLEWRDPVLFKYFVWSCGTLQRRHFIVVLTGQDPVPETGIIHIRAEMREDKHTCIYSHYAVYF
jgi:hypothetical protein